MEKQNEVSNILENDEKLTITVDEAARMLGIGKNNMLDLVKMDSFPAMTLKRKIIINRKQFIKWFDDLTAGRIII